MTFSSSSSFHQKKKSFTSIGSASLRVDPAPKPDRGLQGLLAGGSCREVCKRHKVKINPRERDMIQV